MMKKLTSFLIIVFAAFSVKSQMCMDSTAINYGSQGQCMYDTTSTQTCMDPSASNYGYLGQCEYDTTSTQTCMDPSAMNYGAQGQCMYDTTSTQTCMDPSAMNYGSQGQCMYDTTSTQTCMDPSAMNYGAQGQCMYDTTTTPTYCMDSTASNYGAQGKCVYDSSVVVLTGDIFGCTDVNALNYSSKASKNNGSCEYPTNYVGDILGCMDITALNYNAKANKSDASCIFEQIEVNTPIKLKVGETITDELYSTVASACNINYGKLIDSAIVREANIQGTTASVVWEVWQNGSMSLVDADYDLSAISLDYNGNYVLYVTVSCVTPSSRPTEISGVKLRGLLRPNAITSIGSISVKESFEVIPNPVQDEMMISSNSLIDNLEIIDANGFTIIEIQNPNGAINVSSLTQGIYFVKTLNENGEVKLGKFIKK